MRASLPGSLAESGHQGGQLLASLTEGTFRFGQYLDAVALLDIPGHQPWAGASWGEGGLCVLETQVHLQVPTAPSLLSSSSFHRQTRGIVAWKHSLAPTALILLGNPSLPVPEAALAADPSHSPPGPQTQSLLTRALVDGSCSEPAEVIPVKMILVSSCVCVSVCVGG